MTKITRLYCKRVRTFSEAKTLFFFVREQSLIDYTEGVTLDSFLRDSLQISAR